MGTNHTVGAQRHLYSGCMAGTPWTQLRDPVAIAAFSGWNDACGAGMGVIWHLLETYPTELQFTLDPDDYYDYQATRPTLTKTLTGDRNLTWPTTSVHVANLPTQDLVLIHGPEPNLRWRAFCREVIPAITESQSRLVILLGAMAADTPHTRPVPVHMTASDPVVAKRYGLEMSQYEGPTGIIGVLSSECRRAKLPVVSAWASMPGYIVNAPSPKGSLALLSHVEDLLDQGLDQGELPDLAIAWERGVGELMTDDPEMSAYVDSLEGLHDEEIASEATGDQIAAEFQRYLRRRNP